MTIVDPKTTFCEILKNATEYYSAWATDTRVMPDAMEDTLLNVLRYLQGYKLENEFLSLLLRLIPAVKQRGNYRTWINFLDYGIDLSRSHNLPYYTASFLDCVAELYSLTSAYQEAETAWLGSLTLFEEIGEASGVTHTLTRLASVLRRQHRATEAEHLVQKALMSSQITTVTKGFAYYVLGTLALDRQAWELAEDTLRNALKYWEQTDDAQLHAWGLVNLGVCLIRQARTNEAQTSFEEAIQLLTPISDPIHLAVAQMNLANLYSDQMRYEEAINLYIAAEQVFYHNRSLTRRAMILNNLGIAYRHQQQWQKAQRMYIESVRMWTQLNNKKGQLNALDGLGLTCLYSGAIQDAIAYFEHALSLATEVTKADEVPIVTVIRGHLEEARVAYQSLGAEPVGSAPKQS